MSSEVQSPGSAKAPIKSAANLHFAVACCLVLLLAGCGRKSKPSITPLSSTATTQQETDAGTLGGQSVAATANTGGEALPREPQAPAVVRPVVVPSGSDTPAVLSALTQALRTYAFERRRVPASFDEVVAAGYVAQLPDPPPGKKFAVDAKRMTVVLVKR